MRQNMLRGLMLGLPVPLLLLAACEMKVGKDDRDKDMASVKVGADGNVAITADEGADGVSLSVPGFEGKMKIPGMELGGDDMDIGGLRLYPGSKLSGINITGQKDGANGRVDMRFTSPAAPDKVAAHFAAGARAKDFTDIKIADAGGRTALTAKNRDGDDLAITMQPVERGTSGRILIRDMSKE